MSITALERANVDLMFAAMNGILVDHSEESVERNFSADFVQHNPWAKDGAAHVKEMCAYEFPLVAKRWVAQGDLVGYHGYYGTPNPLGETTPLVCFDLWRVKGGTIIEHWDALMPVENEEIAEALTAGGGDGGADVSDEQVIANAAAARRFLEVGVRQGDTATVDELLADDFIHHAASGPADATAAKAAIGSGRALDVNQVIASGDLVVAHLRVGGHEPNVTWDIFRMDDGRIAEMWSVRQPIAPPEEQANPHPHF